MLCHLKRRNCVIKIFTGQERTSIYCDQCGSKDEAQIWNLLKSILSRFGVDSNYFNTSFQKANFVEISFGIEKFFSQVHFNFYPEIQQIIFLLLFFCQYLNQLLISQFFVMELYFCLQNYLAYLQTNFKSLLISNSTNLFISLSRFQLTVRFYQNFFYH